MIATAELEVQRRLTAMFIAADVQSIVLTRNVRTPDGGGGYTNVKTSLAAQQFRLIPSQDGAAERLTKDGLAVTPQYILLGTHLADMARYDEFAIDGRRYQIVFINENKQYEIKGEVAYVG